MTSSDGDAPMKDERISRPETFDPSSDIRFVPKSMFHDIFNSEELANIGTTDASSVKSEQTSINSGQPKLF